MISLLDILHELFKFFMDREVLKPEQFLLCLSIRLVMADYRGHHLVGAIVPETMRSKVFGRWCIYLRVQYNLAGSTQTHLWIASSVILSFTEAEKHSF